MLGDMDSNHVKATLLWSVACRRLDGGNTIIFPRMRKNANESISLHHEKVSFVYLTKETFSMMFAFGK